MPFVNIENMYVLMTFNVIFKSRPQCLILNIIGK